MESMQVISMVYHQVADLIPYLCVADMTGLFNRVNPNHGSHFQKQGTRQKRKEGVSWDVPHA